MRHERLHGPRWDVTADTMSGNQPTLSCDAVREFDRAAAEEFGLPGRVLMENAGRAVADCLLRRGVSGPVLLLCGKGNNAGDAFVAARHLDAARVDCGLLITAPIEHYQGDAAANLQAARLGEIPLLSASAAADIGHVFESAARDAEWIVDGLLGIGAKGAPRPPLDQLIRLANAADAKRLAIDTPSGLNGDSGEAADPTFIADITCTFAAAKPGLLADSAKPFVGELEIASLGAPRKLLERFGIA